MKSRTVIVSLILPFTFGLGAVYGPDQAAAGPTIAVVDVDQALVTYPRAKRLLDDLKNEKAQREAAVEEAVAAAERMRMELDAFERGSDEWMVASARFAGAKSELDARIKAEQERLLRRRAQIEWDCLQDVNAKVSELARLKKVSVVLRVRDVPANLPLKERLVRSDLGSVLYHDPVLDLTPDLIKLLIAPPPGGAAPNGPPK